MLKRRVQWGIFSVIIAGLSIWAVMSQSKGFSLRLLKDFLREANPGWLIGALLCMFGFIWFEGYAIVRIASCLGYRRSKRQGTLYGAADVYFSAITPSASGGQPASAYFMIRDGMKGPAVTITLLLNLIMYTLALFTLGVVSLFLGVDYFWKFSLVSRVLIGIGSIVLVALVIVFYLLLCRARLLYGICDRALHFFGRIHLIRHPEKKREKLNATMEEYQACARVLFQNPRTVLEAYGLNLMQRLSQFGVSFMIFMASGKGLRTSFHAMLVQCFVSIGSNSVPIPGSMGVADYLMLDGFQNLVGEGPHVTMELLCRGCAFYGCVLLGALLVILGYFSKKRRTAT